ncbi:MAG: sulfur oxidation c-type cytochrome SoxA [Pseudomonadota bacterium]
MFTALVLLCWTGIAAPAPDAAPASEPPAATAPGAPAPAAAAQPPPEPARTLTDLKSGLTFQTPDTRRLQHDPFSNPGMLAVDLGRELYESGKPSCASCHGTGEAPLKGVAATFPKVHTRLKHLLNLEQRINLCRIEHQHRAPWPWESPELLGMTAYIAHQSRGLPFAVAIDGPARPFFEQGQQYFYERRGQLNLGCHHCHEQNYGRRLRGDLLSQGQSTGYPIYRLDWQATGSLHRRLRFCNEGVRANQLPFGDERYVALELFLAWRAGTLPIETPAVRR